MSAIYIPERDIKQKTAASTIYTCVHCTERVTKTCEWITHPMNQTKLTLKCTRIHQPFPSCRSGKSSLAKGFRSATFPECEGCVADQKPMSSEDVEFFVSWRLFSNIYTAFGQNES